MHNYIEGINILVAFGVYSQYTKARLILSDISLFCSNLLYFSDVCGCVRFYDSIEIIPASRQNLIYHTIIFEDCMLKYIKDDS